MILICRGPSPVFVETGRLPKHFLNPADIAEVIWVIALLFPVTRDLSYCMGKGAGSGGDKGNFPLHDLEVVLGAKEVDCVVDQRWDFGADRRREVNDPCVDPALQGAVVDCRHLVPQELVR